MQQRVCGRGFNSPRLHQYRCPTAFAVGHFFVSPRVCKGSCGSLRTSTFQPGPRKTPVFTLSGPFFSPGSPSRSGPKSAKAVVGPFINQQVTCGRINRLFFSIGRRRKPPRFGEWRIKVTSPRCDLFSARSDPRPVLRSYPSSDGSTLKPAGRPTRGDRANQSSSAVRPTGGLASQQTYEALIVRGC